MESARRGLKLKAGTLDSREPVDAATGLSLLCVDYSLNRDGWPPQLAGLGGSRGKQRHHFRNRAANGAMGICAGKRVLHRTLPLQHKEMALACGKQR